MLFRVLGSGLHLRLRGRGRGALAGEVGGHAAVGLQHDVIDRYFTGTASRVGGVGLDVLAREALERHERGFPDLGYLPETYDNIPEEVLPSGGQYQRRRDGERRQWDPKAIAALQKAARTGSWESYEEFAEHMAGLFYALAAGWTDTPATQRLRMAAIGHAMAFETWRSLTGNGLSDAEAREVMVGFVSRVGESGDSTDSA